MTKPLALTAGALRQLIADVDDEAPVVVHAEILDGEFVSVLRLESVGTEWSADSGVQRVVLTAGLGEGETMRKPPLTRF
ncbi:hypothetical protein [Streptomyces atroolivaceus]|uniref:hypothetical protein n=1 Tax=Streptomyces atroolivaceus TaxID=66869 RepID=UPI0036CDC94D